MGANDYQVGGSHYQRGLQHWDLVEEYGIGFLEGLAGKYVARYPALNEVIDIQKANHCLDKLMESVFQKGREPKTTGVPEDILDNYCQVYNMTGDVKRLYTILCSAWTLETIMEARSLASGIMAARGM